MTAILAQYLVTSLAHAEEVSVDWNLDLGTRHVSDVGVIPLADVEDQFAIRSPHVVQGHVVQLGASDGCVLDNVFLVNSILRHLLYGDCYLTT